jgi:hypothetical protein
MGMCRRCCGLRSGCSWGISFPRIGASTFDELQKQPYHRAITAVGVSPETFLLLLLQECDKAAVHFGKNLRNTIPPSGSRGVPPCFIAQAGMHQTAQQDSPTHLPYHPIKFGSDQNCKNLFPYKHLLWAPRKLPKTGKYKKFRVVSNKFLCFTSATHESLYSTKIYTALRTKVLVPSNRHGFW